MSNIKAGRPAFPVQDAATWQAHGLTLRDYFAAKAMQGSLDRAISDDWHSHEIAAWSYQVADAMLKARDAK